MTGAINDLRDRLAMRLHGELCDGYEVAAWPCPMAAQALASIVEETP